MDAVDASIFDDKLGNSVWNRGDCGVNGLAAEESPPSVILAQDFASG